MKETGSCRPLRRLAHVALDALLLASLLGGLPGAVALRAQEAELPARAPLDAPGDTLSLEQAVEVALGESPEVNRARAGLEAAGAGRLAAWGSFLPTASAFLSLGRNEFTRTTFVGEEGVAQTLPEPLESTSKSSSQGLSFGWTLLEGGRRFPALGEAAATDRAAGHRLSLAEREVVGTVERAYYEALQQQRLVDVAERQLQARGRDLEVARRRYEIAAVNRADVLGAEIQVGQAELALLEARRALGTARRALRVAMGMEPEAASEPALRDVEDVPRPAAAAALDPARLVGRLLDTHPEIRALDAEADAVSAGVWTARTRYLPTIDLSYSLNRSQSLGPEGNLFTFDPSDRSQSLSISASWSLFDGFDRERATQQAQAEVRRVEADAQARRQALEKEVRDFVDEIRSRADRLQLLERNRELAERRLEMTREQYRLGSADYTALAQAIEQLTSAERQVITERYAFLRAWAELEQRVGRIPVEGR